MELLEFTKKIYDYFAHTIYGKEMNWRLAKGPKSKKAIEDFLQYMLNKYGDVGGSFMWLYVVFQFGRFELTNFKPKTLGGIITPGMIFGEGSIKKYETRKTIDTLSLYKSPWLTRYKISQDDFVKKYGYTFTASMEKVDTKKVEKLIQKYKDPIKLVTSRSDAGMGLCIDLTDLYNEKDPSCVGCGYAIECKQLLKETNFKIYKLRGYE